MRGRADLTESLFDAPVPERVPFAVSAVTPDESIVRLGRLLPGNVYLGTSSWSFPGWQGIVYDGEYTETQLARVGLAAYALHPLLRTVGIDRGFYQPLSAADFARYARQVPDHFRFVVKAPAGVTDATLRGERGSPSAPNPHFLDATCAEETFVRPAIEGLGQRAGILLFQLPPLAREWTDDDAGHATIDRIASFLAALPQKVSTTVPVYAVELRNAELLTPRFVRALKSTAARLAIGVHSRMPAAVRQASALRALDALEEEGDAWKLKGPLVVRWNLGGGQRYNDAKSRYAPFNRLIDVDIVTRATIAHLVAVAQRSDQPSYVIANNKAEGSAPLSLIELAKAIVD